MKVLFAVSNEEISESIVKRYQQQFKEIISYKNVYYFNAILKEIQKDKTYDRIVISEDLEAFTHTQYEQIDKFIFDKLDSISDEASNQRGDDIPIILICTDRRTKSEQMLVKLFGIGVYNAILGNDRSVEEVCNLINKPRTKKEAKNYYKIDSEDVSYQAENENDVSEVEIQNILAHYKRLGKNEDKYVDSFNNIAAQYNETQLRIIGKFLPLNVRAVLEEKSQKYQQVMSFNSKVSDNLRSNSSSNDVKPKTSEKLLTPKIKENIMTKPVIIPSSVNMTGKKLSKTRQPEPEMVSVMPTQEIEDDGFLPFIEEEQPKEELVPVMPEIDIEPVSKITEEPTEEVVVKRRGRPRKNPVSTEPIVEGPKRGRGRPKKNAISEEIPQEKSTILPGMSFTENSQEDTILPGFDSVESETTLPGFEDFSTNDDESTILPGFNPTVEEQEEPEAILTDFNNHSKESSFKSMNEPVSYANVQNPYYQPKSQQQPIQEVNEEIVNLSNVMSSDKKIACFVGTSKNGTSFMVNHMAEILSNRGIDVAILDTTQNRNSYYIYTKNEESLRNIAMNSIENLAQGRAEGIQVHKNLTVYTSLPDERNIIDEVSSILPTLANCHTVVLIDCDFETPANYFANAQEIYLVQTLDVLTIQPLTAFLRELKSKNVLEESKLRIVLNKMVKVRGINDKTIIGGMAFYNDPAMSFMTELFDRNMVKYISIPFDEEVYCYYLEGLINCDITVKRYPKNILQILGELANMIYKMPQASGKSNYQPPTVKNKKGFPDSMNSTLDQMKRNF